MAVIVTKTLVCTNCAGDCYKCFDSERCDHWNDISQKRREYVEIRFNDIVLSGFYRDEMSNDFIIINLTPHPINIVDASGKHIHMFPRGVINPEVSCVYDNCYTINGMKGLIPIETMNIGEVKNMPDETEGVRFIVSKIVADALFRNGSRRKDLLIPNKMVKNKERNRTIGCMSLSEYRYNPVQ